MKFHNFIVDASYDWNDDKIRYVCTCEGLCTMKMGQRSYATRILDSI